MCSLLKFPRPHFNMELFSCCWYQPRCPAACSRCQVQPAERAGTSCQRFRTAWKFCTGASHEVCWSAADSYFHTLCTSRDLCRIRLWVAVRFRQECYVRWSDFQNRYFSEEALVQREGIMKPEMEILGYY